MGDPDDIVATLLPEKIRALGETYRRGDGTGRGRVAQVARTPLNVAVVAHPGDDLAGARLSGEASSSVA